MPCPCIRLSHVKLHVPSTCCPKHVSSSGQTTGLAAGLLLSCMCFLHTRRTTLLVRMRLLNGLALQMCNALYVSLDIPLSRQSSCHECRSPHPTVIKRSLAYARQLNHMCCASLKTCRSLYLCKASAASSFGQKATVTLPQHFSSFVTNEQHQQRLHCFGVPLNGQTRHHSQPGQDMHSHASHT